MLLWRSEKFSIQTESRTDRSFRCSLEVSVENFASRLLGRVKWVLLVDNFVELDGSYDGTMEYVVLEE